MSRTTIALFDDFQTARKAVEDLVSAGFSRENISIVANDASGEYAKYTTKSSNTDDDVSGGEGAGFGAVVGGLLGLGAALIPGIGPVIAAGPIAALVMGGVGAAAGAATGGIVASLVDMGVSEEDAGYYSEGIRRGGALVTVTTSDEQVSRAEEILSRYNPVDVDHRASAWREQGWQGWNEQSQPYSSSQISTDREQYRTLPTNQEARFDVVEEELQVGKREVEKGGVRVRSYITEKPVQEQVTLREEHVRVDRHPVDRPASSSDINAFQEGVIEVTEKAEQPVVQKTARVVEEVVVGKDVEQRTETVNDTVRRTDVDVEQTGTTGTTGTTATTGMTGASTRFQPFETYNSGFRTHWQQNYANSGYTYEQFTPAYHYGYDLATNDRYTDYDWNRVEPEARRSWEQHNPGTWENFKQAVRQAWLDVTGRG